MVANDAALDGLGFRRYLPFLGGTFRVEGPVSIITSRHLSLLAPGGTIDLEHAAASRSSATSADRGR